MPRPMIKRLEIGCRTGEQFINLVKIAQGREGKMLNELQGLHAEIVQHLDELDVLTTQAMPAMDRLAATRLALTRASRARTLLVQRLNIELARSSTAATRQALEALQAEGQKNLAKSAQHIGIWTLREVSQRWPDYCAASYVMRAAMRERIAKEAALIYPLLGQQESETRAA